MNITIFSNCDYFLYSRLLSIDYFIHKAAQKNNESESDVIAMHQQQRHCGNQMLFTSQLERISSELQLG